MPRLKRNKKGQRIKTGPCVVCRVEDHLNHYGVCSLCLQERLQAHQTAYRNAVHEMDSDVRGSDRIRHLLAQGFSYRFQAEQMGKDVTAADLSRLVAGVEPKSARKRQALGLPVQQLVTACADCGQVHVSKRCTEKRRPATKRHYVGAEIPEDMKQAVQEAARAEGITVADWLRIAVLASLLEDVLDD